MVRRCRYECAPVASARSIIARLSIVALRTRLHHVFLHVPHLETYTCHVQVRTRKTEAGISVSHAEKQSTGRVYVRSILIELGKPDDFDVWIKELVQGGRVETGGKYAGIDEVLSRLKHKVEMGENWKLPESRYGSVDRPIAKTHPKEMTMALRSAIDKESGFTLEKGHFGRYEALKDAERRLEQKRTAALAAVGREADQRRMLVLYDNEQLDLFESILTCAVAAAQSAGDMDGPSRKPIDTLTVGVIVAVYFALGKRGVNLDDLVHGYMTIGGFNAKVWEFISPHTLDLVTAGKGDGSTKKQDQILSDHRDPMRGSLAMLGLYFGAHPLSHVHISTFQSLNISTRPTVLTHPLLNSSRVSVLPATRGLADAG